MKTNISTAPEVRNFETHFFRTFVVEGELWSAAADACKAMGIVNHRDALSKLDDDEKGFAVTETNGGKQKIAVVSESGLYALTFRCRGAVTPGTAPHRLRKWVTAVVLPSIRKTGSFGADCSKPEIPVLLDRGQQERLESAVHEMAHAVAATGRNYRSVCMAAWKEVRARFDLSEYAQLPAARLDEALELVADLRSDWEVVGGERKYTLDDCIGMMNEWYLGGRAPSRVEVELTREVLVAVKSATKEARFQLSARDVDRKNLRAAKLLLTRDSLSTPVPVWCNSVGGH